MFKTGLFLLASLCATACLDGGATDSAEPTTVSGGKSDDVFDTQGELRTLLPILLSPRIQFNPPHDFTAVQPTATLHFLYSSCAKRAFKVLREQRETETLLQLEDHGSDCLGPSILREYVIQVSSDATVDQTFVVLNPSALTFSEPL